MSILLEKHFERSLATWTIEFSAPEYRGAEVQIWLFEDVDARRSAEMRLAQAGVTARFRSAYKPLVHFFLEEVDLTELIAAHVRYPVHGSAPPNRFTLEAYPLAGMLGNATLQFQAGEDDLHYIVELEYTGQRSSRHRVFAPNRIAIDLLGEPSLSPTGWVRVLANNSAGSLALDEARVSDYEQVFAAATHTVSNYAWGHTEPYFERLLIRADITGIERAIGCGDEVLSTFEALHEDFYFSMLEFFQRYSGRPMGDRGLQPGQIVPDIRRSGGDSIYLRVSTEVFAAVPAEVSPGDDPALACSLVDVKAALPPDAIALLMEQFQGQRLTALSRQGRTVDCVYHAGPGPAVLISGGQHANETSGVVGALRAAQILAKRENAHFALIASENPDGYALHRELCAIHPRHMHHAARYSAMGDDIAYREHPPLLEREVRDRALALSGANLHVNLHGYPAHEWTRPLSGYLPRGFELWTIPKGFFLVLRYHSGWKNMALALLEKVTAQLALIPGLVEFNARQISMFRAHAMADTFATLNGIPVEVNEDGRDAAAISLITEFPDETIDGEPFRFAHNVQAATAIAAVDAYCSLR